MSIPLDNLYDWIDGVADDILIYRFFPHGSKKLDDLQQANSIGSTRSLTKSLTDIPVVCHDQEPLDYAHYDLSGEQIQNICLNRAVPRDDYLIRKDHQDFWKHRAQLNLAATLDITISDQVILLHTEKNSPEIEKYVNNGFIPAFWWSHAVISRDWYRFAQHDHRLYQTPDPILDFNIYCRDVTGTRKYRKKFIELLVKQKLDKHCRIGSDDVPSDASATYDPNHYQQCAIDVVLETLFDDNRIYLTEKILRPIACGKPFILAGGPGSLQFLREYGFKTFDTIIDETYDGVKNHSQRMKFIIKAMDDFSAKSDQDKKQAIKAMNEICQHNRRHFFSDRFAHQVVNELKTNLLLARDTVKTHHQSGQNWFFERQLVSPLDRKKFATLNDISRGELAKLLWQCRKKQRSSVQ